MALATTTMAMGNTTHVYDSYDLFIHPHWKQFPLIPDMWHYIIGIYITVVGISGTLGNLLVIYIFGTTKPLRTPSNMFIVNLALSDLTFSAVNGFPLLTLSAFNGRWIFGKVACELYALMGGIFGLMSINTMAAIAVDRYNVITKPMKASHSLSYRKAFIMLVFIWAWSVAWTLPPLFGWGAYIPEGFQTSCTFDYLTRSDYFRSYIMCLYICGFMMPLSVIIFCYFFIYRAVAVHEQEMKRVAKQLNADMRQGQAQQKADIKTAKIAMTIVVAYLLSWLPYATVALIAQFGDATLVTPFVSEVPVMFAKASAMHNPIIYALSHPRFRDVLNQKFPWLLCCCGYSEKEAESAADTKTKMSRMDSVTSRGGGGGGVSNASEISHVSDSGMEATEREVNLRMKNMGDNPENNGALIRDILQAFVGVVNAQGSRQVPVYLPPQYLPQVNAQQAGYLINQGAAPAEAPVPAPPPPPPATAGIPAGGAGGSHMTTSAEVNAHDNNAFQED